MKQIPPYVLGLIGINALVFALATLLPELGKAMAGQFVMCFPELDMVVATNSNAYVGWSEADENERIVLDLVANYIIPAVE